MTDQRRYEMRVKTPLPGFPASVLWPKRLTPKPRVLGRKYQMDELPGAYVRLEWRSMATDEVITITDGGVPSNPVAFGHDAFDHDAFGGFTVDHAGNPYVATSGKVTQNGPLYQAGWIRSGSQMRFFEWWPDMNSGRVRIVLLNGVTEQGPDHPIKDRVGDLTIRYGDTVLHHEANVRHHFGCQTSFRFAIAVGKDGKVAVSKQTAPWPMAYCEIPMDKYADFGLLPRYDDSVAADIARLLVRPTTSYPTGLNDSIEWVKGGASGGGKPQLAPLPAHDVMAMHDPERFLADACYAADRFPYPFFFVDAEGDWIRPQRDPQVWADMIRPNGATFRVPETPGFRVGELVRSPYSTDAAHLPNAFVVPAIMTGDPYYRWASEGLAFGVSMSSRGEAGRGWKFRGRLDGEIISPPSENVVNGRGPTGREGWIGGQERAWGWGLWQRLHAVDLTGHADLVDMSRSCLAIARGHYLDDEITEEIRADVARHWGAHCRPWWYDAIFVKGHGIPTLPRLSDGSGSDAYCRAEHAMDLRHVSQAHASWQDAFMGMAIGKAHAMFGAITGLGWLEDLLEYATFQRRSMLSHGLPVTEYVWPIRYADGWIYGYDAIEGGYLMDGDELPAGGRTVDLDEDGMCKLSGYAYVGFNAVGFNSAKAVARTDYDEWAAKFDTVVSRLPIEWRVRG